MDGKYLRLKNLQIGYTFPKNMEPQGGYGKGTYLCQRTKLC